MRFAVLTFGCRVNQSDSFEVERRLVEMGGQPGSPETADLVVVNTCAVTAAAEQGARRVIRRIGRVNPTARIVATGCYASREPGALSGLPRVVGLIPNTRKDEVVGPLTRGAFPAPAPAAAVPAPTDATADRRVPDAMQPGARGRTAYPLRVQTGCGERCSYCIVPSTRGPGLSRPIPRVLADVRRLGASGYREVWLTGVHLGSFGRDLAPPSSLLDLLGALDRSEGDVTFRLGSLEPMDCTPDVIDLIARSGRFAPHLHLPLQHVSDRMLAAMRRPYAFADFRRLVELVRDRLPDAAIGTDLIVGFPGETDEDALAQEAWLASSPLTSLHVFPYSDRPGTEASGMRPKIAPAVVRRRAAALRGVAAGLAAAFAARAVGRERPALTLEDGSVALTDNYLKVGIAAGRPRNERVTVRILSAQPLRGEVVS